MRVFEISSPQKGHGRSKPFRSRSQHSQVCSHRYCNHLPDMLAPSCLSREAGQLIETSPQCRPLNHLLSAGDSIATLGFEECGYNLKNVLLVK